jgi:hypothetical protein
LKDHDQKLIGYRDTNTTMSMRRNVEEINEALSTAELELRSRIVRCDGMLLWVSDNHVLYPAMRALYRIFNRGSFACGGRFYGAWWQQIPKDIRPNLLIDGVRTIEHDYPQLHPNMLYAHIGARLEGDAYDIDGWPRNLVKRAFNILVNAANYDAALRAIALEIVGDGAYAEARSLIASVKDRHPRIIEMFHSDAGIRLQRRDADMAEVIVRRLIRLGIVALPIHDSFITAAPHDGALKEAMQIAWSRFIGAEINVISVVYNKNDPQVEDVEDVEDVAGAASGSRMADAPRVAGAEAVRPLLVPGLPCGRDFDLFGGRPCPVSDLACWSSGVAPSTVRSYFRDEIVARGLRQSEVARHLGISQPQLANILGGRFGASPRIALALKALAG